MMGCCSIVGLFGGMTFMAMPLIAIGAVVYLLTRRFDAAPTLEDF